MGTDQRGDSPPITTMDKYAETRRHFADIEAQKQRDAQHKQMIAKLDANQAAILKAFKVFIEYMANKTSKTEVTNWLSEISTPDVQKVVESVDKVKEELADNHVDLTPLENLLKEMKAELEKLPKELPEAPEAIEDVKVSNLSDIDFKPFVDAIKDLKLVAEAPVVNVDAPKVEVPEIDVKPLKDLFSSLLKAVQDNKPEPAVVTEIDLSKVEAELKKQTKKIEDLLKKPMGGGGGGGGGSSFADSTGRLQYVTLNADGSVPVTVAGGGSLAKPTDAYSLTYIDDTSTPSTYEYYGYEDSSENWYIKRLDIVNNNFGFVKGSGGGIAAQWSGRAGKTYASYGTTF